MATQVFIPTPLKRYVGEKDSVEVAGTTVGEIISNLVTQYPDLRKHIYDERGKLRTFINIFLNDEDIRHINGLQTVVKINDSITMLPSVAGGVDKSSSNII